MPQVKDFLRKPVVIGGVLGLLGLALAGGVLWMGSQPAEGPAPLPPPALIRPSATPSVQDATAPAPVADPALAEAARQAKQDKRRRLAQVRAELQALQTAATPPTSEKMTALVDKLESLSSSGLDPRYFQALRNMLATSAQLQGLNSQLQDLGTTPQDKVRREALLAEMRVLSANALADAQSLQGYAQQATENAQRP